VATTEEEINIRINGLGGAEHELRRMGDGASDAERATEELREELRRAEEQAIRTGLAYRDTNGQLRDMQGRLVAVGRVRRTPTPPNGPDPDPDPDPPALRRIRRFALAVGRFGDYVQNATGEISRVLDGPAGTALKVGGAAVVGTTALAAAGGAITAGVGAGVAGAGVAGALQGPNAEVIKSEFGAVIDEVKGRWIDATADWWQPIIGGIGTFEAALDSIPIEEIFDDAQDFIDPLARGIGGMVQGIGRGVAALVDKGQPAVEALAAGLDEIGDAAGDAFEDIADDAEGGAEALRDVLFFTAALVRGFGEVTAAAERAYGYIHDHPVEAAFLTMGASLPITLLDQFSDETDQAAVSLDDATLAANGAARGGEDLEDAWEGAAAAMQDAADTADRLYDAQMGAAGASVAWEQSIDDLTESIKDNGKNWDITTQKGRDNTTALMEAIDAAKASKDANIANGMSVADANRKYEAQIAYLQSVALKAGLTKQQFDAMTAALLNYINTPDNKTVKTTFLDVHYVSTEGRIGDGTDPRTKTGKAYASGGEVSATGFSLVGEEGPELRFMNKGDYIATAAETKAMLSGGGGRSAAPPIIRVIVQYPDGRVIRDQLVDTAANVGQDVGQYLGV
jgi:hypothetical protein